MLIKLVSRKILRRIQQTLVITTNADSHKVSTSCTRIWMQFEMTLWKTSFSSDKSILSKNVASIFSFNLSSNCWTVSKQYSAVVKILQINILSSFVYRATSPSFMNEWITWLAADCKFWKSFCLRRDILVPIEGCCGWTTYKLFSTLRNVLIRIQM